MNEGDPTTVLGSTPFAKTQPMTPPQPPASRKWLRGCGCGCLGVLGLCLLSGAIVYLWATSAQVPVNAELAWQPTQPAMAAVHLDPKDAGIAELVQRVSARIDREGPDPIPAEFRTLMARFGKKDTRAILESLLPLEAGLGYSETDADDDKPATVLVSFSQYGNLLGLVCRKLIEADRDGSRLTMVHAGETVEPVKGDRAMWAGVKGHTLLVAEGAAEIRDMIDRLRGGSPELGDLGVYRARLPQKPEACGILLNRGEWLARSKAWPRELEAGAGPQDLLGLAWSADLQTSSTMRLSLHLRMTDAAKATAFAGALQRHREEILNEWRQRWNWEFGGTVTAEGEWVHAEVDVTGFEKDLQDWLLR